MRGNHLKLHQVLNRPNILAGARPALEPSTSLALAAMSLGVSDVAIVDTALMAQLTILGAGLGLQPEQRSPVHALRRAKCAPQNATSAPRHSAARPASTPDIVGIGLGAAAAWPAPTNTSTPTPIRKCCIRCGICPDTALSISDAVK